MHYHTASGCGVITAEAALTLAEMGEAAASSDAAAPTCRVVVVAAAYIGLAAVELETNQASTLDVKDLGGSKSAGR
ncbi:hypothetical protein [Azohydromonas australica]|uniref:hypothetical protein n=1 Tax=Azohydromonas australica TaxID=364039 RepID=UPI0012EBE64C|nr:hypothetical protein [Azohydromonas australica]